MGHTDLFGTGGGQGLGLAQTAQGQGLSLTIKDSSTLAFGRAVMFHGTPAVPMEKKETNKAATGKTGGKGGFSFWGGGGSRSNSSSEDGGGVGGSGDGSAVDMLWIPKREDGVSRCTVSLSPTPGQGLVADDWEEEHEPGSSPRSSHQHACPPALMFTFPAAITDTPSTSSTTSLHHNHNTDGDGSVGASGVPVGVVHGATMSLIPRFSEMCPLVLALAPGSADSVGQHSQSQQQQQQVLHRQQQASLMIPGGGVQVTPLTYPPQPSDIPSDDISLTPSHPLVHRLPSVTLPSPTSPSSVWFVLLVVTVPQALAQAQTIESSTRLQETTTRKGDYYAP